MGLTALVIRALGLHTKAEENRITKEVRDASMALWMNVIRRSECANYATREAAEHEITKVLARVTKAVDAYDLMQARKGVK
jgi:hypothetical protein